LKTIKNEQNLQEESKFKMAIQEKKGITILLNSREELSCKKDIRAKFKSLLKQETIRLLSNLSNYTKSLVCQICNQKIQNVKFLNHFHLYTEDKEQFITFHFTCAFKPGTADDFIEIAGVFDYVYSRNQREEK